MSTCNYFTKLKTTPLVVFEGDEDAERWAYEDASEAAAEFSEGLRWYKIEARGGYYTGVQLDIIPTADGDDAEGLDDETARDWYDMSAEELAEDMARERREAARWIRGWIRDGWLELGVAGVFSNGEAVYYQIAPRRLAITGPESVADPVHVALYSTAAA